MEPEGSLPCSQEPPIVLILSYMDPDHIPILCIFKIHFDILSPTLGLPNGLFMVSTKTSCVFLVDTYYSKCPVRLRFYYFKCYFLEIRLE
jgi:hypothetical protein